MAINCSSPDRFGRTAAAALLSLALIMCMLVQTAHAQDCWRVAPGHGEHGVDHPVNASTLWDPDGPGPLPVSLVLGPRYVGDHVRYWNGSAWMPLGGTFNQSTSSLAVYSGHLYVSGAFSRIGSTPVNSIARWNGTEWVQVGTGLGVVQGVASGTVYKLHVHGGLLYLGGSFRGPGSTEGIVFVAWNGSDWVTRAQPAFLVYDLHTYNGDLCAAGGGFSSGVARFTNSSWESIGQANNYVRTITSHNSLLYAGGAFTTIDGVPASRIARWDGSSWLPVGLGTAPTFSTTDRVTSLTVYNGHLIAAGRFESMGYLVGSAPGYRLTKNIARWDGLSQWWPLGSGVTNPFETPDDPPPIRGFEVLNNELVAYGGFSRAGTHSGLDNIARWNSQQWLPMAAAGINARVRTFFPAAGYLFAGGDFAFAPPGSPGTTASRILSTNGSEIGTLSQGGFHGVNGNVTSLSHIPSIVNSGTLVVGGAFTSAGGIAVNNIARFNLLSQQWSAMGAGLNGSVSALTNFNGAIYAAGSFTSSGTTSLPGIARWTGSAWVSPGNWTLGTIVALGTYDNKLLISRISPSAHGVSTFDGTTLTTLGAANGAVRAFITFEGDLIVGGDFTTMNGVPCNRIARRNRLTGVWSQVGQGFPIGGVRALANHHGQLYAGGSFVSTVAPELSRIARWDRTSWVSVNGGVDTDVWAMQSYGGRLHIGGDFNVGIISSTLSSFSPFWITSICGCYPNCDNSSTSPVLNIDDFTCFINSFAAAQSLSHAQQINHYTNCDRSLNSPVLNIDDFTCFINRFAIGCP
jgi:trimeric autotransporter adhesin